MITVTEHTRNVLLETARTKRIYVEGNFLKLLKAPEGDTEFEEYLKLCKEKDLSTRKKRLEVTKQVQNQNNKLAKAAAENECLLEELKNALQDAKDSEKEASKAKAEAEALRDTAVEDLETLQKRTQFELIGLIVKVALWIILGVGTLTTILYVYVLTLGIDAKIIESTWSNLFGILLTNSFSIIGTIMGVKYATEGK